ncbi:hypothetical protein GS399_11570 [Pedobacter sp. HMF7647]|uniref:Toxin-antitoxin system YwqK family antitoxin n=1 Tax=Hufsiella arboris TaxID=2695275 RepID=A0A7K1YB72_9SPHI|nr:hypothetical protein [Hufsiella arboris]MXV51611.1 hypothetical protein [Hufsiella arboris]
MRIIIVVVFLFLFASCKLNQTVNGYKEGKWIYGPSEMQATAKKLKKAGYSIPEDAIADNYHYKGRYKHGQEKGTWRYYLGKSLVRKERYKGYTADVEFYHFNGKVDCKGKTFFDTSGKIPEWYYIGSWSWYDEDGRLAVTRKYDKGIIVNETYYQTN